MKLQRIIEGTHNKQEFRYEDGILIAFARRWDRSDIQTLVEIANLLALDGYALKVPKGTRKAKRFDSWGNELEVDEKEYE